MNNHGIAKIIIIIWLFCIGNAEVSAQIKLNFGVYTSDKPTIMVRKFRPMLNELESILSNNLHEQVTIKMHIAKNYKRGLSNITQGKVDFTRLGPATYVQAKIENPAIHILAMESEKGKKEFNGVICVRNKSAIKNIRDIKGKRFAFGNQQSTIGRYLVQQFLYRAGLKISDLRRHVYFNRHDQVAYAVASGDFDAGALKESTYKRLVKKGLPINKLITFKNITKPWVARANLPLKQLQALQKSLLSFHAITKISHYKKNPFLESSDSDYSTTRQSILESKLFFD